MPIRTLRLVRAAVFTAFGSPFIFHAIMLYGFYVQHNFGVDPSLELWLAMVAGSIALGALATFILPFMLLMTGRFDDPHA